MNGDLEKEIYMEVPSGFESDLAIKKVYKLKKTLYKLKQFPRAWVERFFKVMKNMGYKQSQGNHILFVEHSNFGGVTALLVYAEDIIMIGNNEKKRQTLRQCLTKEFEIKELGRLKYFLGIKVAHSKQGIFISQQKYVTDFLKETRKLACRPASTPIDVVVDK